MKVNKIEKDILVRALHFYANEIKNPCKIVGGPAKGKMMSIRPDLLKLIEKVESLER